MSERIKVVQIGSSHEHAGGKLRTLRNFVQDEFEVAGFVDDRAQAAYPLYSYAYDPAVYAGLRQLTVDEALNVPGLEAVFVETQSDDLVPVALRCAELGLPIHLDKPAGEDMGLYRKLLAECGRKNVPLQLGYMFRCNRAMQFCREAVRKGWLGEIFEISAGMSHDYGGKEYQEYIGHFRGGLIFNLGCHFIDFAVSMLGRPCTVQSVLSAAPGSPDRIKNNCVAILGYPRALVTIRACSSEVNGSRNRRLKVCGTCGTIEMSPLEHFDGRELQLCLTLTEGNECYSAGTHTVDCGVCADRYEEQLRAFARIIRGEEKNPYSLEHEALVQEVTLAASGILKWEP